MPKRINPTLFHNIHVGYSVLNGTVVFQAVSQTSLKFEKFIESSSQYAGNVSLPSSLLWKKIRAITKRQKLAQRRIQNWTAFYGALFRCYTVFKPKGAFAALFLWRFMIVPECAYIHKRHERTKEVGLKFKDDTVQNLAKSLRLANNPVLI